MRRGVRNCRSPPAAKDDKARGNDAGCHGDVASRGSGARHRCSVTTPISNIAAMFGARSRLRTTLLLLAGTLAVHELRYTLASPQAHHEVAARHAYLLVAVPLVGVGLAFLLAQILVLMSRGHPARDAGARGSGRRRLSRPALWLTASVALAVLFVAQETLESLVSGGGGAAMALFGIGTGAGPNLAAAGGWLVLPLALAFGALVPLALGAGEARLDPAPVRHLRAAWRACPELLLVPRSAVLEPGRVLARHLAGRAPPGVSAP